MNKILKKIRQDINDYDIRIWGEDVFIHGRDIFCCLDIYENELLGFGLQTNLDENREEKVLKLCLDVANSLKKLQEYLESEVK